MKTPIYDTNRTELMRVNSEPVVGTKLYVRNYHTMRDGLAYRHNRYEIVSVVGVALHPRYFTRRNEAACYARLIWKEWGPALCDTYDTMKSNTALLIDLRSYLQTGMRCAYLLQRYYPAAWSTPTMTDTRVPALDARERRRQEVAHA